MGSRGVARFGVSGWDYADWRGPVYPDPLPKGFRPLTQIARFTQFMEVNVSYYRIIPPTASARWVEETPASFSFLFKAWGGWTHEDVPPAGRSVDQFRALVAPCAEAGRLDGVLCQFPPQLSDRTEALDRLCALRDALAPHRIFAEFRHRDLYRDDIWPDLEREGIAFVNVDLPAVRKLPPLTAINTGPVAYLRLHGRRSAAWARSTDRNTRYDYTYSPTELDDLADTIEELLGRCPQVLVGANNHYSGQAPATVAQLRHRVEGVPCAVPERLRRAFPELTSITERDPEAPAALSPPIPPEEPSLFNGEAPAE